MIKELYIDLGLKEQIYGKLYLPENKHYPFVVMSHGLHSNYTWMEEYAIPLLEAGIGSLVFDFTGGSKESKSGGNYLDMTIQSEVSQLVHILEILLDQEEIDISNLYIMGESQGGLVSAMAGRVFPELKGIILLYPAMNIPDLVRELFPEDIPETPDLLGYEVGKNYIKEAKFIQIRSITRELKDVLIIHGSKDPLVPVEYIQQINELYPHSELVIIEGAKHGFEGKDLERANQEVIRFIQKKS